MKRLRHFLHHHWPVILLVVGSVVLTVLYGRPAVDLLSSRERIQTWLARLGPWGPLGLLIASMLQVVFAPIPGYLVQVAGGYLFGPWTGGFFSVLGMCLGGATAMTLGRAFGRPFVAWLAGEERLAKLERFTHSDSPWTWFVLLSAPFGDIPWYLAGLSRVAVWRIVLSGLVSRTPSVVIAVAFGAGIELVPRWAVGLFLAFLVIGTVIFFRYREQWDRWLERKAEARLGNPKGLGDP